MEGGASALPVDPVVHTKMRLHTRLGRALFFVLHLTHMSGAYNVRVTGETGLQALKGWGF